MLNGRGVQIPGSRSPWRLNFVRLLQMWVVSTKPVPSQTSDGYNCEVGPRFFFFFNFFTPDYGTYLDTLHEICKPQLHNHQYFWAFFSEDFPYLLFWK